MCLVKLDVEFVVVSIFQFVSAVLLAIILMHREDARPALQIVSPVIPLAAHLVPKAAYSMLALSVLQSVLTLVFNVV